MKKAALVTAMAIGFALATPGAAQNVEAMMGYAVLIKQPVPVTEADITDRPYRVIGRVETVVRKATVFDKRPSREKVFRELWERGQKLKADAVIQARYASEDADALRGLLLPQGTSIGQRASGLAVRFLTDAEIAALPKPAKP